jgi:hypothetical protein
MATDVSATNVREARSAVRGVALKSAISAYTRTSALLVPRRNRIAYVGPGRSSNLGDRAMFLAHQAALPAWKFQALPVNAPPLLLTFAATTLRSRAFMASCLGGGTIVGHRRYRNQLAQVVASRPDAPAFTLGVGVEDPRFIGTRHLTSFEELQSWRELLESLSTVNVRGPDSQELLHEIGIESRVTGDPALLLGDHAPRTRSASGVVGINIGTTTELWGNDPKALWASTLETARLLIQRGLAVRVIPVWPPDRKASTDLVTQLGHGAELLDTVGDVDATIDSMRGCDAVLGMKLHALVFAASVFVPTFALAYRPKCLDFQRSIGREAYAVRTNAFSAPAVAASIIEIVNDRDPQVATLRGAISERRRLLSAAVEEAALAIRQSRSNR